MNRNHRERGRNAFFSRQAARLPADFGRRKKYSPCHLSPERGRCGAGASHSSGSQTQFQNPRQLPLDYFGKRPNPEAPPPSRHFPSLRSCLHTRPKPASSFRALDTFQLRPLEISCFQLLRHLQLESDFLGWRRGRPESQGVDGRLDGGKGALAPPQSPLWEPLPPPPHQDPLVPEPTPPPFSPQGWPLLW